MSSLDSIFKASNELVAENESATHISVSFIDDIHELPDRIKLVNSIMLDQPREFRE